ncbi:peptidase [Rhodobacteraceae bacterium RKSG542]|uniref:A24 family peptidase n=1 Tax=Pseudovibrio flavus TaxID=2529854 RepID=UPI0012BCB838|nr:prepilin peptidase [Pseudovibrio flavus]MTI17179.1 peptidase [Pseudovibrio flavus]
MVLAALMVLFPLLMLYAAFSDLFTMTIPNKISLLLLAGFVVLAFAIPLPIKDVGLHLLIGFCVLAAGFGLFALGVMGGGDAKFAAGIALWLGYSSVTIAFLLQMAIYGAILTLVLLVFRSVPVIPAFAQRYDWVLKLHDKKTGIPYGIAIAIAALQVYPKTFWFEIAASGF